MLTPALELAAAGWAVHPCRWCGPNAKAPLLRHGHLQASTDPAFIRECWTRWPYAMIGVAVPRQLLVLDLDPRNGGTLDALEAVTGPLPATLTTHSGRRDGGMHLYYLRPVGKLTAARLPAGVDLKANGYCIAPPSLHPAAGQPYVWEERPPATLPPAAREALRPAARLQVVRTGQRRNGSGAGLVAVVARHTEKGVNNALYWAARRATKDGILTPELTAELVDTAVSVGEARRQAERTVESARNRREAS